MTLDPWNTLRIAMGLLFVLCYAVLLLRHLRSPGSTKLLGGSPLVATLWGVGIMLLVLAGSLPLPDRLDDGLSLVGCMAMLAAFAISWRQGDGLDPEAR